MNVKGKIWYWSNKSRRETQNLFCHHHHCQKASESWWWEEGITKWNILNKWSLVPREITDFSKNVTLTVMELQTFRKKTQVQVIYILKVLWLKCIRFSALWSLGYSPKETFVHIKLTLFIQAHLIDIIRNNNQNNKKILT